MTMHRGEVWVVSLNPSIGSETKKTRRVVIVSNNARNAASSSSGRGVITITPLTKNVSNVLPFQAFIAADQHNGLDVDSKTQAEQIRALDVSRFVRRVGALSHQDLAALDEAMKLHLALH